MIDMTKSIGKAVWLPIGETTINVSIHEENSGYLILEKTLPPQFTHRRKNYSAKTIWFCEEILKRVIKPCKIDKIEQLRYIFTKGLTWVIFEYLSEKLMGW